MSQPPNGPEGNRDDQTPRPRQPGQRRMVERVRTTRPGQQVLRVTYQTFKGFSRRRGGRLQATLALEEPRSLLGRFWRLVVGQPLHNELETTERLSKKKALPIFSSDALSSVGYAPQETLVVLLTAGVGALAWSLPISIAIIILLAIVVTSYRQTIYAYPSGGGSYIVARHNLGETPGLIAASALVVGYILTVSVSIASAVDQLVSALPGIVGLRVGLGVGAILLVTIANLRGIRESGSIFALPTYFFVITMYVLVGTAFYLLSQGQLVIPPPEHIPAPVEALSLLLVLRAFTVGSAVMTGTEAISNGVPAFQAPEPRNAARTIVIMAIFLGTMSLGLAYIIHSTNLIPSQSETVISQISRAVFGDSVFYYIVQGSAVLILVLAANTAYADFPRLASLLARDEYAPYQLAFRGERLAFSNGIILLGLLSSLLIVAFGGSTGELLPLYALAVFSAFTFSQLGMVQHWRREKGPHWHFKAFVNGLGAAVTGLVALIAALTNFMDLDRPIIPGLPIGWGSWIIILIVPIFVWTFKGIHTHYTEYRKNTSPDSPLDTQTRWRNIAVVPVGSLNRPAYLAIRYARSLCEDVVAVHVAMDQAQADKLESEWRKFAPDIALTIIDSPYRSLTRPLMQYLDELKRLEGVEIITVVLPEYVPDAWWEHLLHGQSAHLFRLFLLFRPGFVVTSVPWHEEAHQHENPPEEETGKPTATPMRPEPPPPQC